MWMNSFRTGGCWCAPPACNSVWQGSRVSPWWPQPCIPVCVPHCCCSFNPCPPSPCPTVPCTVTTGTTVGITETTATIMNNQFSAGCSAVSQTGVEFSTSPNFSPLQQATSQQSSPFDVPLIGLTPGTMYFYRAFADTACGRVYGLISSFTTTAVTATVTTGSVLGLTGSSASIINNTFTGIPGTIAEIGVQYSTNPVFSPVQTATSPIMQGFTVNLSGLSPLTTYYYRAYVNSSSGLYLGNISSFTTLLP